MKTMLELITTEMEAAFEKAGYDKELAKVTLSNRPDLCEYPDSDISVLKRSIISFIMRTLGMFRKYLRRHIYHLWKIQRNHMLLINMKLRCFGQGNLILI